MALGAYSSSILKPAIAWMLVISLDILCRFVQIAINCADQNADRNFEDGSAKYAVRVQVLSNWRV